MQPFFGYCYGARNKERLTAGLRFTLVFGLAFCFVISALCYIFAEPIVKIFLTDLTALNAGIHFTRILMTTGWLIGPFIICQNTLQAMGAATPALSATVIRQGVIFVPAVLIMKALIGVDGLIWAQPITDVLSLAVIIIMLLRKINKTDFSAPEVVAACNHTP